MEGTPVVRPPRASNPLRIEYWPLAGAIALEGAFVAHRVGPLENPVLPRGQPAKDARFQGLGASEAQIGLQSGQRTGGESRASLQHYPDIVVTVEFVVGD